MLIIDPPNSIAQQPTDKSIELPPLPIQRPLLMIGHGTKNPAGRQSFLDFAAAYQALDASRPVVPCFPELTTPTIEQGVMQCVQQGYTELSVVPILLFAARHNKFDVTNELDRAKQQHPQIKFHYGRHFGITPGIIQLWRDRLAAVDNECDRADTVLLFVGRGSSDSDANGDVCKMARILWEGSGYSTVETCFIGITHPRLEEGFRRARLHQPKRIVVLPYFLFTGLLVEKIFDIAAQQQQQYPEIEITCLPEIGLHPQLFSVLREREIETQVGSVQMNCEMCKFRLAAVNNHNGHSHHHHHDSHHHHDHHHDHHHHDVVDVYADEQHYHQKIWQVP